MRQLARPSLLVLAVVVAVAGSGGSLFAQGTQLGGNTSNNASGGLTEGVEGDFDTGASLQRTERRTRDTSTFVGAAAPTAGNFGAVNDATNPLGGGNQQFNQQRNFFNMFNQNLNQFNNNQRQQNQLRIPLRLGFAKPPRPATQPVMARELTSAMQGRFSRLERFGPDVSVTLDGNTAVLSGWVADEDSRKIAARMVMLEPGITAVRNDLQVASATESLPPGR